MASIVVDRNARGTGVAVLKIDRPPVNALDVATLDELSDRLDELAAADVDGLVLTGTGPVFSAGADLVKVLDAEPRYIALGIESLRRCFRTLFVFPRPVVAAVNGHALAGGAVLTCACDHRVIGESGMIGAIELKAGVPFPGWALEIVRYAVNNEHVAEVVNFGRMYEPRRALDIGLIDEVTGDDVLATAIDAALELAAVPRRTFSLSKLALRGAAARAADLLTDEIDEDVKAAWSSPEVLDAVRRQMESIRRG